jgi:hypothetical protein
MSEWFSIKDRIRQRSGGACELCEGIIRNENGDLHHRWYGGFDGEENLMLVHRRCHTWIHGGGTIHIRQGSLADRGDMGKGDNEVWRTYLVEKEEEKNVRGAQI